MMSLILENRNDMQIEHEQTPEKRKKQERNKTKAREKQDKSTRETRQKQERNKTEGREKQDRRKRETRQKQERNKTDAREKQNRSKREKNINKQDSDSLVDKGNRPSSESDTEDPDTGSRMLYMKETTPQTPVPRNADMS